MKSLLFCGIVATIAIVITATAGLGSILATAQMADNATMGNMTGGNMTGGNMTDTNMTGSISGVGVTGV